LRLDIPIVLGAGRAVADALPAGELGHLMVVARVTRWHDHYIGQSLLRNRANLVLVCRRFGLCSPPFVPCREA
jgi:hypothetical protein